MTRPDIRTLVLALALLPGTAIAQSSQDALPDDDAIESLDEERVTRIDFGLLDVTATVDGPDLKLVDGAPLQREHKPMIRIRTGFDDMMAESADQIR